MIPLKTRYDNDELQVLCVGKNEEHIWVTIFDLYDYMTDEVIKTMPAGENKESLENLGRVIRGRKK